MSRLFRSFSVSVPVLAVFLSAVFPLLSAGEKPGEEKPVEIKQTYQKYRLKKRLHKFVKFDSKAGMEKGRGALVMDRPVGSVQYDEVTDVIPLVKNTEYTVTFWAKAENLKASKDELKLAVCAIVYEQESVRLTRAGIFPKFDLESGTFDWKKFQFTFRTGSEFDKAYIAFYLHRALTGKVLIGGYTIVPVSAAQPAPAAPAQPAPAK